MDEANTERGEDTYTSDTLNKTSSTDIHYSTK